MTERERVAQEVRQDIIKSLCISDEMLKAQVEDVRESMTVERALDLVADIADNAPDLDTVDPIYRVAFIAREAYTRGALVALDSYREAIKATLDGAKGEGSIA